MGHRFVLLRQGGGKKKPLGSKANVTGPAFFSRPPAGGGKKHTEQRFGCECNAEKKGSTGMAPAGGGASFG